MTISDAGRDALEVGPDDNAQSGRRSSGTGGKQRRPGAVRRWWISTLLVLVGMAALIGAAVMIDRATPSPMSGGVARQPLIVPVERSQLNESVTVSVAVVRSDGLQVSTKRSGVVTSLAIRVNDRVAGGTVLATVDDQPVIAMTGDAPLIRDLGSGAEGKDVQRLEQFLVALGIFKQTPDHRFDRSTASAVQAFNSRFGLGRDSTFRLDAVAWIGAVPAVVGQLTAQVGSAVGPGTALFKTPGTPVEIKVTEGQPTALAPGDKVIVVGDVSAPYKPGTGRVTDPGSVRALGGAIGSDDEAVAHIRPATTTPVVTVPSSAVITDASGTTCVFTAVDASPVVVHPIGGGVGSVYLPADTPLTVVLANPSDVIERLTCS